MRLGGFDEGADVVHIHELMNKSFQWIPRHYIRLYYISPSSIISCIHLKNHLHAGTNPITKQQLGPTNGALLPLKCGGEWASLGCVWWLTWIWLKTTETKCCVMPSVDGKTQEATRVQITSQKAAVIWKWYVNLGGRRVMMGAFSCELNNRLKIWTKHNRSLSWISLLYLSFIKSIQTFVLD